MVMKYIISEKQLKFITEQESDQKNNIQLMYAKIKWEADDDSLIDTNGDTVATYPDDTNYIVIVLNNKDVYFSRDIHNDKFKKLNPQDIEFVSEYKIYGGEDITWVIDVINEELEKGDVLETKKIKSKGVLLTATFKEKLPLPSTISKKTHPEVFETQYTPEGYPIPIGLKLKQEFSYGVRSRSGRIIFSERNWGDEYYVFNSPNGEYYVLWNNENLLKINKNIIKKHSINRSNYESLDFAINLYENNKTETTSIIYLDENKEVFLTID
jgi:LEA14-like dessication related protein